MAALANPRIALGTPRISASKLLQVPAALDASIKATKVEYRQLGRSGLRVSNPILGGAQLGSSRWFPWVLDRDQVSLDSHRGRLP